MSDLEQASPVIGQLTAEQLSTQLLDSLGILACVFEAPSCRLVFVNEAYCRYFGRAREELIGVSFLELVPEEDREVVQERIKGLQERGGELSHDHRVLVGGEARWHRWKDKVIEGAGPQTLIQSVGQDVTEKLRMQRLLERSQQHLMASLEAARIGFWTWLDGEVEWDERVRRIHGVATPPRSREEFLQLVHPEDRDKVEAAIAESMVTGVYNGAMVRVFTDAGEQRWVLCKAKAVRNDAGEFRGLVGATIDVSPEQELRRRLEETTEQVRQSEELFRSMFQNAPLGVALVEEEKPVLCNPALERILGYRAEELARLSFADFTHPDDVDRSLEHYRALMSGRIDSFSLEKRYVRPDGTVVPAVLTTAALDSGPGPRRTVAMLTDMSERKSLERQLQRAERLEAVGTLAAGIAHDFNNILNIVLFGVELATEERHDPRLVKEELGHVRQATERGIRLVRQILEFSRGSKPDLEEVDLLAVVSETLRLVRATLPTTVEIRLHAPPTLPPIVGAESELQQVLLNLSTNALHALGEAGGTLEVTLRTLTQGERPEVLLEVRDDGAGIPESDLEHVFDPFYTTKLGREGCGLGLAIAHRVVQQHNGRIEIESREGEGTAIKIFFPAANPQDCLPSEETAEAVTPKPRVLVAEDEPALARQCQVILQRAGYEVTVALDGAVALEHFEAEPEAFDLVVTDFSMPKLNGRELGRAIRARRPDLPLILSTGFLGREEEAALIAEGFRLILYKPLTVLDLREACEIFLAG